jgi:hypothetical protein
MSATLFRRPPKKASRRSLPAAAAWRSARCCFFRCSASVMGGRPRFFPEGLVVGSVATSGPCDSCATSAGSRSVRCEGMSGLGSISSSSLVTSSTSSTVASVEVKARQATIGPSGSTFLHTSPLSHHHLDRLH